jgi:hypothetical protein
LAKAVIECGLGKVLGEFEECVLGMDVFDRLFEDWAGLALCDNGGAVTRFVQLKEMA